MLLYAGIILIIIGGAMLAYLTIGTIRFNRKKKASDRMNVKNPVTKSETSAMVSQPPVSGTTGRILGSDSYAQPEEPAVDFMQQDVPTADLIPANLSGTTSFTSPLSVNTGEGTVAAGEEESFDFFSVKIGNAQDIGARNEQQDSFGISDIQYEAASTKGILAVVADGMGGMSNGALYSKTAVHAALQSFAQEIPEKDDESTLLRVLKRANDAVAEADLSDGGTTFIAVLIHDRQLHFVSVGDSRISLMRNGGLIQLNREHVYGRELDDMVANGLMDAETAENDAQREALTSYMGMSSDMKVDRNIRPVPLYSGDKIVLMSDGVYAYIPEEELKNLLMQEPMQAAESVRTAILMKQNPRQDNLTIVILEI